MGTTKTQTDGKFRVSNVSPATIPGTQAGGMIRQQSGLHMLLGPQCGTPTGGNGAWFISAQVGFSVQQQDNEVVDDWDEERGGGTCRILATQISEFIRQLSPWGKSSAWKVSLTLRKRRLFEDLTSGAAKSTPVFQLIANEAPPPPPPPNREQKRVKPSKGKPSSQFAC